MIEIGNVNNLKVVKWVGAGVYMDGRELGEILLPNRYVPENCNPGDKLYVFIYHDSEDRLIATTLQPYAMAGEAAWLKVIDVNDFGAFLDWGLPKDLLVPFAEQQPRMIKGRSYLVFVYLDEQTQRITASSRLEKFISSRPGDFKEGQPVDLIIGDKTDLGYKAVMDHRAFGMLYHTEIFQQLKTGQKIKGFVKTIRNDGKIDLCLEQPGYDKVAGMAEQIIREIAAQGGYIDITDKSSAEDIYNRFGISKKNFKKAVGALYKARRIVLEKDGIALA